MPSQGVGANVRLTAGWIVADRRTERAACKNPERESEALEAEEPDWLPCAA